MGDAYTTLFGKHEEGADLGALSVKGRKILLQGYDMRAFISIKIQVIGGFL
jgi:hypothetical protein